MTAPVAPAAAVPVTTYAALDAAYREAVARIALTTARVMLTEWASVDSRDLARTSSRWLARSVETILAGQVNAAQQANAYAEAVRRLSVPNAPSFTAPPPAPPNVEQIRKSLIYTGLATTSRELARVRAVEEADYATPDDREEGEPATRDRDSDRRTSEALQRQIMEAAIARAAGAATRHVVSAGQDQVEQVVRSDKVALGWYRTTKAGCCYFCAMLASRGLDYKEDSFKRSDPRFVGDGNQKVHDNCGCGLRPVYSRDDPMPDQIKEFSDLWIDAATGSGDEAIRNFRRVYEGRRARPARPE